MRQSIPYNFLLLSASLHWIKNLKIFKANRFLIPTYSKTRNYATNLSNFLEGCFGAIENKTEQEFPAPEQN